MSYSQRDIVKVKKISLPEGKELSHPCLIISCNSANKCEKENFYTGVMITHSKVKDRFTKEITKEMMEGNWPDEYQQIRLHIIVRFNERDISQDSTKYLGRMKNIFFKSVIQDINDFVLMAE